MAIVISSCLPPEIFVWVKRSSLFCPVMKKMKFNTLPPAPDQHVRQHRQEARGPQVDGQFFSFRRNDELDL